jgi:hypothetical protein
MLGKHLSTDSDSLARLLGAGCVEPQCFEYINTRRRKEAP